MGIFGPVTFGVQFSVGGNGRVLMVMPEDSIYAVRKYTKMGALAASQDSEKLEIN